MESPQTQQFVGISQILEEQLGQIKYELTRFE